MENNVSTWLENIARVGIVSAIDGADRKVRVRYDDLGITSGWLYVLQHNTAQVDVAGDGRHEHIHEVSKEPDHQHQTLIETELAGGHDHDADEDAAGEDGHVHNVSVSTEPDHTHGITQDTKPAGEHDHDVTESVEPDHNHDGTRLAYWMPQIGERVVVLYLPVRDGDGFVLGGF